MLRARDIPSYKLLYLSGYDCGGRSWYLIDTHCPSRRSCRPLSGVCESVSVPSLDTLSMLVRWNLIQYLYLAWTQCSLRLTDSCP